ncbi:hypothetical protein MRX96_009304 [Rhipicephalus microplus]
MCDRRAKKHRSTRAEARPLVRACDSEPRRGKAARVRRPLPAWREQASDRWTRLGVVPHPRCISLSPHGSRGDASLDGGCAASLLSRIPPLSDRPCMGLG